MTRALALLVAAITVHSTSNGAPTGAPTGSLGADPPEARWIWSSEEPTEGERATFAVDVEVPLWVEEHELEFAVEVQVDEGPLEDLRKRLEPWQVLGVRRHEKGRAEVVGRGGGDERQLPIKVGEERLACGGVADGEADRGPGQSRGAVGVGEGADFEVGKDGGRPRPADRERVGWDRRS